MDKFLVSEDPYIISLGIQLAESRLEQLKEGVIFMYRNRDNSIARERVYSLLKEMKILKSYKKILKSKTKSAP